LTKKPSVKTLEIKHISTDWQSHNIRIVSNASKYWNNEQKEAAYFGTLLHDILAKIKTADDINLVLDIFLKTGKITALDITNYQKLILQIVNHSKLKDYYTLNNTVYNECEIVTSDKALIRLDRLILKGNKAVIIDYKTGIKNTKHQIQINNYAAAVKEMGYTVTRKILVYIQDPITVVLVD